MRALFDGFRRIVAAAEPGTPFPPATPTGRMGPGRYDPVAREAQGEIANARAPLDWPVPAHALAEIADLRRQLAEATAEATAAANGRTLAQLTADMPKTMAGRISELAAVRADRDRLERINDRLRAELADAQAALRELRATAAAT